jgi:hypothetical protein
MHHVLSVGPNALLLRFNLFQVDIEQRFPNFYTLRPPQDFALFTPPPREKTQNTVYGT